MKTPVPAGTFTGAPGSDVDGRSGRPTQAGDAKLDEERPPDGALIDDDHLAAPSFPGRSSPEGVDELRQERALAGPGNAGDARQHALGYPDGDVAQVGGRRVLYAKRVVEGPAAPARRSDRSFSARGRGVGAQQVVRDGRGRPAHLRRHPRGDRCRRSSPPRGRPPGRARRRAPSCRDPAGGGAWR